MAANDTPDTDPTIEEQFMSVLKDIDSRLKGIDARMGVLEEKYEDIAQAMEEVREAAAYIAFESAEDEDAEFV